MQDELPAPFLFVSYRELGTEEKFKAAADCLFSLPSKCGYLNYNPASFTSLSTGKQTYLPGSDVLRMRYSCVAGLEAYS